MKQPQKNKKGSVGIDIVDVARFTPLLKKTKTHLLKAFFTDIEIAYCGGFSDPDVHFAGTFAAKEAASKALGVQAFPFKLLEIRRAGDGAPAVFYQNRRLKVQISITHTKTIAAAIAVL